MKKIIATIAVMALMLTFFAACGKKRGDVDFQGGNQSTVVAPSDNSSTTSSEVSSEIKDIEDIWGNVSISVDTDSITSKPSTSKPSSSKPATSKPAATTSQSATTSSSTASSTTSQGSSSTVTSSQVTSSQATSSKGTTSHAPDDPAFGDWIKP